MRSAPLEFVRRMGHNASRAARLGMSRLVLPRRPGVWLLIRLAPPLDERRLPSLPFSRDFRPSLLDLLQTLEAAAADPQIDGILLRLAGAPRGWAKVMAVRRAVEAVVAQGKPVAVYGEQLSIEDLYIASAATRCWLPESGGVFLVGLRAEGVFLRGALSKLGVEPDLVRVGGYKSAGDMFLRDAMSPEQREQTEAFVDDLYTELVDCIARGRGLDAGQVRDRVDRGPYTAPAAVEAGLVDGCLYPDQLEEALELLVPIPGPARSEGPRVRFVEGGSYTALRGSDVGWRPLLGDLPRVAYVVASGMIHRGRNPRGIGSDGLRGLLESLRKNPKVRGVVLRLNSSGGDALASDLIWRAVQVTRRDKPVVVSMGDVAASGGYYIAAAADAVFAESGTLTGSIGVVGGKAHLSEFYRRIGVGKDAVERGERAGLMSDSRPFTSDERVAMRHQMEHVYDGFVRRVAEGRGLEPAAVERVAQGRVWSGVRARGVGLVDGLGGPLEALRDVCRRAGLPEDQRVLLDVHPRHPSLLDLRSLVAFGRNSGGG